jgi:hypothetical protein
MIFKCIAIVFVSLALAGCCISGNGCYAPVAGAPIGWDGLGSAPSDVAEEAPAENPPRKPKRARKEIILGPIGDVSASARTPKSRSDEDWAQQEASDQAEDARLRRQLKICNGCTTGTTAREDTLR